MSDILCLTPGPSWDAPDAPGNNTPMPIQQNLWSRTTLIRAGMIITKKTGEQTNGQTLLVPKVPIATEKFVYLLCPYNHDHVRSYIEPKNTKTLILIICLELHTLQIRKPFLYGDDKTYRKLGIRMVGDGTNI